jgi:hypothetical protein
MNKKIFCFVGMLLCVTGAVGQAQEQAVTTSAITVETAACTAVTDRMPVGTADKFPAEVGKVFLWCKVTGAADGSTITHVWNHEGKEIARVDLNVNAGAWRTWSSKTIPASWTGNWEVKVLGPDSAELKSVTFTVGAGE